MHISNVRTVNSVIQTKRIGWYQMLIRLLFLILVLHSKEQWNVVKLHKAKSWSFLLSFSLTQAKCTLKALEKFLCIAYMPAFIEKIHMQ